MKYIFGILLSTLLLWSCQDQATKKTDAQPVVKANTQQSNDFDTSASASKQNLINFERGKVGASKKLPNGVVTDVASVSGFANPATASAP